MIIENHNPNCQDIQILLNDLLLMRGSKGKKMVIENAKMENKRLNVRDIDNFMPTQEHNWEKVNDKAVLTTDII